MYWRHGLKLLVGLVLFWAARFGLVTFECHQERGAENGLGPKSNTLAYKGFIEIELLFYLY